MQDCPHGRLKGRDQHTIFHIQIDGRKRHDPGRLLLCLLKVVSGGLILELFRRDNLNAVGKKIYPHSLNPFGV